MTRIIESSENARHRHAMKIIREQTAVMVEVGTDTIRAIRDTGGSSIEAIEAARIESTQVIQKASTDSADVINNATEATILTITNAGNVTVDAINKAGDVVKKAVDKADDNSTMWSIRSIIAAAVIGVIAVLGGVVGGVLLNRYVEPMLNTTSNQGQSSKQEVPQATPPSTMSKPDEPVKKLEPKELLPPQPPSVNPHDTDQDVDDTLPIDA